MFCFERTIYQQCTQRAYKRKDAFPIRRLERQLLKVLFQQMTGDKLGFLTSLVDQKH